MRRAATRPSRAPVRGPAAWLVRFTGVYSMICPLGFGAYTIPSIFSAARGNGPIYVWVWETQPSDHVVGQPYGSAPLELTATRATVLLLLLLVAFLAACTVQLAGGILLVLLRPSGFAVLPAGMLLSAVFWWGFDLPLAWPPTATLLPILAAAWLVYQKASRNPSGPQRPQSTPHEHPT